MADNLKIALQLKKAQEDIANLLDAQTKALEAQYDLYRNISQNYDNVAPQEIVNRLGEMKKAIEDAGESARKSGQNSQSAYSQLKESLRRASDEQDKYTNSLRGTKKELSAIGMMSGMFDGFVSGLKFSVNSTKMFATWLKNVTKQLGMLSFSIITAPFQILRGFINDANSGGGSNELLVLLENIRKEFGNLKTTAGLATRQIAKDIRHNLGSTGLATRRIYGNLKDTLEFVFESAKHLGVQFENVTNQLKGENARNWVDYIKGLGLTEQGQKALADTSYSLGVSMNELSRQIGSASLIMGAQFGISAKHISRDVGDMMSDFKNFGNLAPSVLVNISVFARKLGVDLKGLLGVVDKFDNFEDAARSAAHLTQAFGLQLDALELMKEQDPAARIEMLRKSFFSAGRSIESMTRQERALLQQQTGLEDSALRMVFAQKNQALSYSDIQKKGAAAQKSQLNQTEVLKRLADQIERMIKSGSQMQGGFWDRFWAGFDRGMKRTIEYRRLMINLRRALRATYRTGMQVGREFVKSFPGIKQFFGSLANMFEPRRFRSLLGGVKNAFFQFFHEVGAGGGKNSFKNFVDNLKKSFLNYFNANSSDGRRILDSFKTFFRVMANVFASGVGMALKGLTKAFRFITDLLTGKQSLSGLAASGEGAAGFAAQLFEPIYQAFVENGPAFGQAVIDLLKAGWNKVKNYLKDNAFSIGAFMFAPAIGSSIIKGITTSLASYMTGGLIETARRALSHKNNTAMRAIQQAASTVSSTAGNTGGIPSSVTTVVFQVGEMAHDSRRFNLGEIAMFGGKLAAIAVVLSGGMVLFAGALFVVSNILADLSIEDITKSLAVAAASVLGMVGLSNVMKLMRDIDANTFKNTLAAVGLLSVVVAAMAANLRLMQAELSGFEQSDASKIIKAVEAMAVVYGAATIITGISAAIGAVLIATGGTGIAAIAAGLVTLTVVVDAMALNVAGMMYAIDRMNIGAGFERKLDGFLKVTGALGSFVGVFIDATQLLRSSLIETLLGNSFIEKVDALNNFFNQVTGKMQSLFANVVLLIEGIPNETGFASKATVFNNVVGAMSAFLEAMSVGGTINTNIMGQLMPVSFIATLNAYMTQMSNMLIEFSDKIVYLITRLSSLNITESSAQLVSSFSGILSSIGSIIQAIKPDSLNMLMAAGFDLFNNSAIGRLSNSLFSERTSGTNQAVELFGQLASSMLEVLNRTGFFNNVQDLIRSITNGLRDISEEKLKNLSGFSGILSGLFNIIGTMLKAISVDVSKFKGIDAGSVVTYFSSISGATNIMFNSLKDALPNIIQGIMSIADQFSGNIKKVETTTSAVKNVLDVIGQLPQIVNSFGQMPGGAEGTFNQDAFKNRLKNIGNIVESLFPASGGPMEKIIEAISRMNVPRGLGAKAQSIQSSIDLISSLKNVNFQEILNTAQANTQIVQAEAFTHIATNIQAMIQGVNEIAVQLGQIRPVNINTQLKALSRNMGLGRSEEITLQHRNFELNVTFDVKIDAEDLEKVLLSRPGTQFATNGKHTG